jgi:hypothetical protein
MDNMLGSLEGTVDFMVNDCLKVDSVPKQHVKANKDVSKANK